MLQLREDLKNGVYVENLREYNVRTVADVLKLLFQVRLSAQYLALLLHGNYKIALQSYHDRASQIGKWLQLT